MLEIPYFIYTFGQLVDFTFRMSSRSNRRSNILANVCSHTNTLFSIKMATLKSEIPYTVHITNKINIKTTDSRANSRTAQRIDKISKILSHSVTEEICKN